MEAEDIDCGQACRMCGARCKLTKHHLVPASKAKGKLKQTKLEDSNFIWICRQCHDQIHALYSNNKLRDFLSTLDLLLADEKLAKFIAWRKKHLSYDGHSKMSNSRR